MTISHIINVTIILENATFFSHNVTILSHDYHNCDLWLYNSQYENAVSCSGKIFNICDFVSGNCKYVSCKCNLLSLNYTFIDFLSQNVTYFEIMTLSLLQSCNNFS